MSYAPVACLTSANAGADFLFIDAEHGCFSLK